MARAAGPVLLLLLGLSGGFAAQFLGVPLPFMLGSLVVVATTVIFQPAWLTIELHFPPRLREAFVVVIGTMIGGTFTATGIAVFENIWVSFAAVPVFVVLSLAANYAVFRRIGGYDRATAFYAGMPGGLVDSVTLGEEAGGDARVLTIQHFVRIVVIVTCVPLGFWLWTGSAVGSSAGVSLDVSHVPLEVRDVLVIGAAALVGYFGGRAIRLPAYFFVGPLVVSAAVHAVGLTSAQLPAWMLAVAQLVVGTGFGARFAGTNRPMLVRALGLGLLTSAVMMTIGGVIAALLTGPMGQSLQVLVLCFAPGGISEMGLIALSLHASPVFVTAHHLLRILLTVFVAGLAAPRIKRSML